jgi:hypothetical protein
MKKYGFGGKAFELIIVGAGLCACPSFGRPHRVAPTGTSQ